MTNLVVPEHRYLKIDERLSGRRDEDKDGGVAKMG
jgi:hypothetical protein